MTAPFQRELDQQRNGLALMQGYRPASGPAPATDKQLGFLEKLRNERVVSNELDADISIELEQPSGPTKLGVSSLIDDLLKTPFQRSTQVKTGPKQAPLPEVPAGHYAITVAEANEHDTATHGVLKFYRVDRPTEGAWAGWTFVKVQASDDYWPVKGDAARKVLEAILEAGPQQASIQYGHELGVCGVCGRTLTDEDSRAAGIGPVCSAKMEW